MPDIDQHRQELARFLRGRRERLSPGQVGFPAGPRRRIQGLRREEVAVLAGISPTWYTYLEQGRDIRPSPDVLDRLAHALRLDEDERRYLHALANGRDVVHLRPLEGDVPPEEIMRQLVDLVDQSPYPAYAGNAYCDLIAWNTAATEWYDEWGRLPADKRNMMRWLLTSPIARERLPDWENDARDIVARWRADVVKRPEDTRTRQLVAELNERSQEFATWWANHDVRERRTRVRVLRHPRLGLRTMRIVALHPFGLPTYEIVLHTLAAPTS